MTRPRIIDLARVRALRRHDAVTREIRNALGFLRQDADALHRRATGIAADLTEFSGYLDHVTAGTADTVRFCRACQETWSNTDLEALERARDRLAADLTARFPRPVGLTGRGDDP